MKKIIFTSISFMALCASVWAQTGHTLTVFSEDGEPFYLILNGIRQNGKAETNVKITGLNNPYYKAKVIFKNNAIPEINKNVLQLEGPDGGKTNDVVYNIRKNKSGVLDLKWYSAEPIQQSSFTSAPPQGVSVYSFQTTAAPMEEDVVITQTTRTTARPTGGEGASIGINVGGVNIGANININDGFDEHSSHTVTTTTTTRTSSSGTVRQPAPVAVPIRGNCPMPTATYNSLKGSVTGKSFASDKMTVAKQATKTGCLSADQIGGLMRLFSFENDKLDYAKFAYEFCYDKENYFKINDVFEFSGSIDELNEFIGGR